MPVPRQHLTPLAGRQSGPVVNGIWALANLTGAWVALRPSRSPEVTRWGKDLLAFEAGYLAWAAWMAASERLLATNSDRRQRIGHVGSSR